MLAKPILARRSKGVIAESKADMKRKVVISKGAYLNRSGNCLTAAPSANLQAQNRLTTAQ